MPASIDLTLADLTLTLLPDRAVWVARRRTLLLADLHLGKAAAFRSAGIPVPEAVTAADLDRLARLCDDLAPRELVILGDLLHARTSTPPAVRSAFADWRARHPQLIVTLVRGNHDRSAGDPPRDWDINCVDQPHDLAGIALHHEPPADTGNPAIAGHLHPAAILNARGDTFTRAPCYWLHAHTLVLPAFGSFTGMKAVRCRPGDRVIAVGPGELADISPPPARHAVRPQIRSAPPTRPSGRTT